jgi:choline dehydrogenase
MVPAGRFDVLVVGGGSAGCVLAARLSEDPSRSVCLIEAGPDYGHYDGGRWPADMLDARSVPDSHDWALAGGPSAMRARIIGGCSAHNACFAIWGSPADYDEWGDGLGFETLRPYLERAEAELGVRARTDEEIGPWHRAVLDAASARGLPVLHDFNDPEAIEGVAAVRVNARGPVRWNAAFAYLDPARERPNLTIRGGVHAVRVEGGSLAVRDADGETSIEAGAIVLAAGAYGSPAILLRSGIGPADHLAERSIPVVADLPGVGSNLVDHYGCGVYFEPNDELRAANAECVTRGSHFDGQCLAKARSDACPDGTWDLHLVSWSKPGLDQVHITVFVMKPESRGSIRLSAVDPLVSPAVDHGFLTDPGDRDLGVLLDGVRLARELAATEPLRGLVAGETLPGQQPPEAYAREAVRGYFHPIGTCRMGPAGDPLAVVDGSGRVHGFDDLYVADAAVMPSIPRANTNVTVVAVAELLAERIAAG